MARILITKLGLDGHDVGIKVLSVAARDAGHEVIVLGIRQTVQSVTQSAVQEDPDLIAVSILSGAHLVLLPELVAGLRQAGVVAPVIVGGMIPDEDGPFLREHGVAVVVPAGVMATEAVSLMVASISTSAVKNGGH
jgi:methylmalonyl-CoA mutase C-terminal domain/subunit